MFLLLIFKSYLPSGIHHMPKEISTMILHTLHDVLFKHSFLKSCYCHLPWFGIRSLCSPSQVRKVKHLVHICTVFFKTCYLHQLSDKTGELTVVLVKVGLHDSQFCSLCSFAGSISGDNFDVSFIPHDLLRPLQSRAPSGPWLYPNAEIWGDEVSLFLTDSRKTYIAKLMILILYIASQTIYAACYTGCGVKLCIYV